jgi:DNA segregation ATPase FtsK/SpoIIIE, S-DNA-T family
MTTCGECRFEYESVAPGAIGATIEARSATIAGLLRATPADRLAAHRAAGVWSALEYGAHVRDVVLAQRERLVLVLVEDRPSFARMYRDERVELLGYAGEDPATVADQLEQAAALTGRAFRRRTAAELARPLVYNYPAPMDVDLLWMGRHTVHEAVHHLGDIHKAIDG